MVNEVKGIQSVEKAMSILEAVAAAGVEVCSGLMCPYTSISGYMATTLISLDRRRPNFTPDPRSVED